jgi:hypothetical protein
MSNKKTDFKAGDRVMTIQNSKPRYGTIGTIYGNNYETIAVVKFETEKPNEYELKKVKVSDLILIEETEAKKSEPVEKSEITITQDEFRNVGINVITKLTVEKPIVGLAFTAFLAELHKALFFGEVSENS